MAMTKKSPGFWSPSLHPPSSCTKFCIRPRDCAGRCLSLSKKIILQPPLNVCSEPLRAEWRTVPHWIYRIHCPIDACNGRVD